MIEWATVIEGGIPIVGGLYATALGYGLVQPVPRTPNPRAQKTRDLFRWLGPLVVLFGLFTAWQTHARLNHPTAEEIARGVRSRLHFPLKVDAITQATDVEGRGDVITFEYSVASSVQELGGLERVQRALDEEARQAACSTPDTVKLLGSGYTVQRHYRFQNSTDQVLITIPAGWCAEKSRTS